MIKTSMNSNFENASSISLFFWFNPLNAESASSKYIVSLPDGASNNGVDVFLGSRSLNYTLVTHADASVNEVNQNSIANNTWYCVTLIYDGTTFSGYINGHLVEHPSQNVSLGTGIKHGTTEIDIGRFGTLGAYFNGYLDEVRVYNRALSASEIKALYEGTK
jgi:hypothetical protein